MRWRRLTRSALLLAGAASLVALYFRFAPDRYDISAPLDLTEAPTFVTILKLNHVSAEACFDALDRAGVAYTRAPDNTFAPGCYFKDAATLDRSRLNWGGGVTLACPMLARLVIFEQQALTEAARQNLSAALARVDHFGSYACRNVNHGANAPRSEHAVANAIDIAGFRLSDGRRISVLGDFGAKTPEGRFLDRVFDRGCFLFQTALGPDYNALHENHFHFDDGPYRTCR